MLDLPSAHQHLAVFGAAVQGGDDLAGVEQTLAVKGALDAKHLLVLFCAELHAHAVHLFDAHAVLARHRAAHGDAGFQDVCAKLFAAVHLVGVCLLYTSDAADE